MDQQQKPNVVVITREPSRDMTKCELTHIQDRIPIDFDTVKQQHKEYVTMFEECGGGVQVVRLPALERYPDAVFVEDPFLLTNECAIITRPIASRQQEYEGELLAAVKQVRPFVHQILEPGHCEGGDMFVAYEEHKAAATGRKFLFIGKSTRSNDAAFEALKRILGAYSYQVIQIPISKCLHLKSAVTLVAPMTVLLNPEWVDAAVFAQLGFRVLTIDPLEPDAGNVLYFKYVSTASSSVGEEEEKPTNQQTVVVNHRVVVQKGFPKTAAKIRAELGSKEREIYYSLAAAVTHRWEVVELQYDELAKAEGALTCCSLIAYC